MLAESRCIHIFWPRRARGVRCVPSIWLAGRSTGVSGLLWAGMCAARRDFCLPFYCYAKGFPKRFKSENPTFYDHTLGNWTVLTLQWTMSLWKVTAHTARTVLTGNGNWKLKTENENENWKCLRVTFERAQASPSGQLRPLFCQKC